MADYEFMECEACAAKPGSQLCQACVHNRTTINVLARDLAAAERLEQQRLPPIGDTPVVLVQAAHSVFKELMGLDHEQRLRLLMTCWMFFINNEVPK